MICAPPSCCLVYIVTATIRDSGDGKEDFLALLDEEDDLDDGKESLGTDVPIGFPSSSV